MRIKNILSVFLIGFMVTLIVNASVVYGWSYLIHGAGIFNWPASFALAISMGILCAFLQIGLNKTGKSIEREENR